MSEKIIKEFTFNAPSTPHVEEGHSIRQIMTNYRGSRQIWVYVDVNTGKNPFFVSEGDLPDPTTTHLYRSVLLDANNPNHILLMDLLSRSKGHSNVAEFTEELNNPGDIPEAPEFVFKHSDLIEPPAWRYYDLENTHVDEQGVVTYQLHPIKQDYKDSFINFLNLQIVAAEEKLFDPLIVEIPSALARVNRYIAVLKFARDVLVPKYPCWKIAIPRMVEV